MNRRKRIAAKRAAADVITLEEVAARLGIGRNQAYEAVQTGKIPALRFGRRWLIPRARSTANWRSHRRRWRKGRLSDSRRGGDADGAADELHSAAQMRGRRVSSPGSKRKQETAGQKASKSHALCIFYRIKAGATTSYCLCRLATTAAR
jgi:excisionase family DNA binding protein